MAETSDRYRRLAADMTETIQHVPDERWGDTSPCPDWPAGPSVNDDPLAAWVSARDQMQADLDDPERAGAEFDGSSGRTTFAKAVDRFICLDLVIHRWDLARATGQDAIIDPSELECIWQDVDSFGDKMRVPGAFGEAIEPRPDASPQDRLLAYLGRQT